MWYGNTPRYLTGRAMREWSQCLVAMLEKGDISTLSAAKEADVDGVVKLPMLNVVIKTAGR